ncbi:uncharacterized protein NECHADRAFT_85200 [Fusarium vanettenii 77-13-4]|uniref:Uncharacterized protein n=1 Tax=Fusarium vanettenii (strain ATCC MYA-4622 / CBS 123669 / FGSC 9596 / NRRL 45880 / 77-13-4) TaxID=660122 RepID=C7YV99_FUSV7|nr:uncharacterized protein NECHADRAFT_85200 [Fusarium vanettenii 77-13-4]EEU44946.1 predicted protein [Fusarium vanettenii 77-13-4]
MASPGDGDSQAPPTSSAGNDLGKRKRNSVHLYFYREPVTAVTGTLASKRRGPPPRRSRVDSDTTTAAQQPPPEPDAPDDSDPGATPVQFDADQEDQESPPALPVQPPDASLPEWLYNFTVKHQDIESLLDVFYQSCYPFARDKSDADSTSVKYPAEVIDDADITETSILQRPDRVSFLRGWNFCTDLYRLLQYLDDTFKTQQQFTRDEPGSEVANLLSLKRAKADPEKPPISYHHTDPQDGSGQQWKPQYPLTLCGCETLRQAVNQVLGEASSAAPDASRPTQNLDDDQHSAWPMPQPHILPSIWNDTTQYPLNPISGPNLPNPTHDTATTSNHPPRDQPLFDDLFHTWSFLIGEPDNLDPADSFAALGMMPRDAYRTSLAPRSTNEANDASGGNMQGI